jgi:DNA-directed RNA polymerase specialized sigma24 family protein
MVDRDWMDRSRPCVARQRAAFVLSVVGGLMAEEIGAVLGCRQSTVRVHIHRTRVHLATTHVGEANDA